MYEKAGGITTGMTNLKNHRFAALKEIATEASAEDVSGVLIEFGGLMLMWVDRNHGDGGSSG
jgi:hypothetical protein